MLVIVQLILNAGVMETYVGYHFRGGKKFSWNQAKVRLLKFCEYSLSKDFSWALVQQNVFADNRNHQSVKRARYEILDK